ncbi:hypothetical protein CU024_0550 [Enterococcus faecium]|nr:hypothetical protein [Enterococcus faecium]MBK4757061.1 hypothetical protein [Enterococcus faecium]MBK4763030.1 hypothetical protein [Enterococcus faecium]MBK4781409.1 hypothetical protein [Enterococcus faecium]MBK4787428.1 hypothetical protein [Enterococcus faecium]
MGLLIPTLFFAFIFVIRTNYEVIYSKFYFFVKTRLFLSREKQGYDKLNTTS